jgi:diacylglycerol kinase family enzyme
VLFVNPRSGDGAASRHRVVERARERGVETVLLGPADDLTTRVQEVVAAGADALGVAGGDGSLADVAAVAAAHGLPFVCIPVGTRNHFALDVGVDRQDVPGASDAFTDGVERLIDVGEVNGRIFLNNVSLGIYGEAVSRPAIATRRPAPWRRLRAWCLVLVAECRRYALPTTPVESMPGYRCCWSPTIRMR